MLRSIFRNSQIAVRRSRHVAAVVSTTEPDRDIQWENARPFEEIPGPKPAPIVGNIWRFLPGIGELSAKDFTKQHERLYSTYGPIVRVTHIPGKPDMVFLFRPEDIKHVLQNGDKWPKRAKIESIYRYRTVNCKDQFGGLAGLSTDQGETWYKLRTLVNPVLMQTKTVNLCAGPINEVAEEFVNKIPGWLNEKSEKPDNFLKELHKWALESIALVVLDTRLGCLSPDLPADSEAQKMVNAVHEMFETIHRLEFGPGIWKVLPVTPAWRSFVRTMDYIGQFSLKHIEAAKTRLEASNNSEDVSVLGQFLKREVNPTRAMLMAVDMLMAGVDTTSHALTVALLQLAKNPEAQDRLYEESRSFLVDPSTPLNPGMLGEMKYLKAVIKESMRIEPIVPVNSRCATRDMVVGGYRIPAGVDFLFGNGLASRLPENCPEPSLFLPERWLRDSEESKTLKPDPFAPLPFGHGARKCVGMRFASLELEILLVKLIRRFRWDWKHPDMVFRSSLVQVPDAPLRFHLQTR